MVLTALIANVELTIFLLIAQWPVLKWSVLFQRDIYPVMYFAVFHQSLQILE